jgi:hypothetical protein
LSAPDSVFESYHKQWQYVSPTPGTINSNQSIGDISLPVELSSFRAISGDSHVRIVWITEAELDNLGFIVERSDKKEGDYLQIASYESMESLQGAGNSSENRHYSFIDYSVFNGLTYWYRLIDVSTNGIYTVHVPVSATPQAPPEPVAPVPEKNYPEHFNLAQNYPNPFNPKTKIGFVIANKGEDIPFVNLSIFDVTGKKVKTLHNGFLMPDSYEIEWNGLNEKGDSVAGGVYIYVLNSQGCIQSRKMLLLR